MTPQRALTLVLLVAAPGCASLEADDDLWFVPPLSSPELAQDATSTGGVAALGTGSLPGLGARWSPGRQELRLEHVLTSLSSAYPLISAARQYAAIADAKQLQQLGAFDLNLKGGATWAARGYYENNTADAGLRQATGLWGLEVWGGYRLGAGDFDPTFDGKRVTNHGGEFRVGAQLPLLRGGSIDAQRADLLASELERGMARDEIATTLLGYELSATSAYWDWVAAGRRLRVAETLLRLAEERQAGIQARVRRGDLSDIEAIDNNRLLVRRRGSQIKAQRGLEKASIKLSLYLRDDRGRPLRPARDALPQSFPSPPEPPAGGLMLDLEAAQRQRPELVQVARRRERAELRIREADNDLLPQLDVFVSASQDLTRSRPSPTKGEFELTAGLEFGFPLQNRKARGKRAARLAERSQLIEEERYLRDLVEAEVRDAFSALQTSYARVAQAREAARLAEQVAAAERRRFELGDSTVLNLNLREAATAEAELQLVDSLVDFWTAAAAYRVAVGQGALPTSP